MNINKLRTPSRFWGGLAVAFLAALTMAESAVAQLKVAVLPSFTQNQTYGNAAVGETTTVWGRAWGGSGSYTYAFSFGGADQADIAAGTAVGNASFIGHDVTYSGSGSKTITLTVTDTGTGDVVSRSATVRVFLNPDHDQMTNIAISKGLLWLYRNQTRVGSDQTYWVNNQISNSGEWTSGVLGFCVLAFEENGHKPGNDYVEDIYAETVQFGLNRILTQYSARTTHGSGSFFDHSDGIAHRNVDYLNGNGFGAHIWSGGHATYANGICGLALCLAFNSAAEAQAATINAGGPFNGLSYFEVIQDLVEQMSFSLGDHGARGGWIYSVTSASHGYDGSTQQWPCLLIKGAEDVLGIQPADWVRTNIDYGFTVLQNGNGAIGYRSNSQWLNTGKTGGAMVGWSINNRTPAYGPVQNAINYIGNQYYQPGGWNPPQGWAGYFYAMYGMKKGLSLMEIETIPTSQGNRDWYADMCAWLLGKTPDAVHASINPSRRNLSYGFGQHSDGRWTGAEYYDRLGNAYGTANAILILVKSVTVPKPSAVIDQFTDALGEVKAGENVNVSGGNSFHQGAPDFVINQYLWILRDDDGNGSPVGALDWNNPDYTGVNIVLDRDPNSATDNGLLPGTYHLTLRVRDDADPTQYDTTTEVFTAVNKNFPPVAVPIPPGQVAYTAEFVPGNNVQITLDGTHSSDPENDPIISYAWDLDGDGLFNDPDDQALADDATSPTPTLTFSTATNIEVGLQVCSQDEFGDIKCSENEARIEIFISEFDLFIAAVSATDINQGVSADIQVLLASDLAAAISNVQIQLYDGLPPAYGGSGVALGGVNFVDFTDDGNATFTSILSLDDFPLNPDTEEVFAFLDSNQAFAEHDESQASNVGVANVSNQPPTAAGQDITVSANGDCEGIAVAADFDNGSSDPDGDPLTISVSPEGPYPLGTTVVTLTVTDTKDESDSVDVSITVVDDTAPVLAGIPADATVECDSVPGAASPTATDNCSAVTITLDESIAAGATANDYVITRVWTATDEAGNSSSGTQVITVVDTTAPVLAGVPADATVECDSVPGPASPTASDNCDASPTITFAETIAAGATPNDYVITRVWTATDVSGNSSSATQVITVIDSTAPVLAGVPSDVTVECDSVPAPGSPTASDNCDGSPTISFSETIAAGISPNDYVITRVWTATDVSGNSSSATQVVTVQDTTPPVVVRTGAESIVLYQGDSYTDQGATVTDNCDDTVVVVGGGSVDTSVIGVYTLTYDSTDASGNIASQQSRTITVLPRFASVDALFGCTDLKQEQHSVVNGSAASSKKIDLHANSTLTGDAVNVNGNIDLKKNASIGGDATAGGSVTLKNGASVGGAITENATLVEIPLPVLALATSGSNVTVKKNKTETLAPGAYKKLSGKQNTTINLSSGHYTFQSIDVDKGSTINLDVTNGPITVDVVGALDFDGVTMVLTGGDATDVLFQVQGNKAKLGSATVGGGSGSGSGSSKGNSNKTYLGSYVGTYLVPNGQVTLENNAVLTGSGYAQKVHVKQSATVNAQPALDLLIAASVNWLDMQACVSAGGSGSSKSGSSAKSASSGKSGSSAKSASSGKSGSSAKSASSGKSGSSAKSASSGGSSGGSAKGNAKGKKK